MRLGFPSALSRRCAVSGCAAGPALSLRPAWADTHKAFTVLMAPRTRVEIVVVADNPNDWMFNCHISEHMASGMMAVIRVT